MKKVIGALALASALSAISSCGAPEYEPDSEGQRLLDKVEANRKERLEAERKEETQAEVKRDGQTITRAGVEYTVQSPNKPWSMIARDGLSYERFELRPNDDWHGAERVEVYQSDPAAWEDGVDYWLSFSMRVADTGTFTAPWFIVGQLHDTPDPNEEVGKSPEFVQEYHGETFTVMTRHDAAAKSTVSPEGVIRYSGKLAKGVWHSFVYKLRMDPSGDGYIQGWLNGEEFIPGQRIPIGYNDKTGPYWKYGAYRGLGLADERAVVEYANMELTTDDISDRIANPRPTPALPRATR